MWRITATYLAINCAQNKYGVQTSPFIKKDPSYHTQHSPNHNGCGAEPDYEVLS